MPTRHDADYWFDRAREARADAAVLVPGSKTRDIMLSIAANYERMAETILVRQPTTTPERARGATTKLNRADKLLLQAEEYRAIAEGMIHAPARASILHLAEDCEQAAARSIDGVTAKRTPEYCLLMARECEFFAASLPPDIGKNAIIRIAEQWKRLAQRNGDDAQSPSPQQIS
jgi:hypothetical protein